MDRLVKIPVVQATLQAEVLSLIGNSIAQLINGWGKDDVSFDWKVLGLSLVVQLVMVPPNFHWQLFLEKQFPAQISTEKCKANAGATSRRLDEDDALETGNAANDPLLDSDEGSIVESPTRLSFRNTFIKWFIDCILVGLWVNILAFIVVWGFLKGHNLMQIRQSLREDFVRLILDALKLWPAASVIGLTLIRAEMRMVFYTAVGMCWGIYMTIVAVLP